MPEEKEPKDLCLQVERLNTCMWNQEDTVVLLS